MNEFRKNVIKRDQMEKRRKAKEEEKNELIAYNMEQLREKKDAAHRRVEESNQKILKKQLTINKRLAKQAKNGGPELGPSQQAMLETFHTRQIVQERTRVIQQMNMQRRKMQQKEYKQLLIENLQ